MNLFYTHLDFPGDATDVPIGVGSCHQSAEITNIPFVSAEQAELAQWCQYLADLSLGSFLLLFSKH